MKGNCYGCRFAIEQRDHIREGEQVRCAKAEELFGTDLKGGKRWVNVRRSENTGKLLNSKCGTFEELTAEDFRETAKTSEVAPRGSKQCTRCKGSGFLQVVVMEHTHKQTCMVCKGRGLIQ